MLLFHIFIIYIIRKDFPWILYEYTFGYIFFNLERHARDVLSALR